MRLGSVCAGLMMAVTMTGLPDGVVTPALAQESVAQDPVALEITDDSSGESTGKDVEGDLHQDYYYPAPQTVEHYASRVVTLPDSDKIRRQGFVIGMARQQQGGQFAPDYVIFAKGEDSQKLIITALHDGSLDTIYRARGLFASLTMLARATPFFQKNAQPEEATFFDLLKLLGFRQVTVTDGKEFCHQVIID